MWIFCLQLELIEQKALQRTLLKVNGSQVKFLLDSAHAKIFCQPCQMAVFQK